MMKFSVCMSVYKKDNLVFFKQSIDSLLNQTLLPSEIILVVDGPIEQSMLLYIDEIKASIDILQVVFLEKNKGHAIARQQALNAAQYDYVAIMDADDICLNNRFEKQVEFLEKNKNVDVLGGQISEFIGGTNNIVGVRVVPCQDGLIKKYMKIRCPMNLVTIIARKSKIMEAGGYIDWHCEEDYFLWIRMFLIQANFANLSENLVYVRVGKEMYSRRGGWRYFISEAKLQCYMYKHGIISIFRLLFNIVVRLFVQILMPNKLRGVIFQKLFRKKKQ